MFLMFLVSAMAVDVVWVDGPPAATVASRAREIAGPGRDLEPVAFRAAAADVSADDRAALAAVEAAFKESRAFETRLDGELLILAQLERPLARIEILPDEAARDTVFAALVYQGFAAWRYYGDLLGSDDGAAPWRIDVDGVASVRPWVEAMGVAPGRQLSPYDLAEGPARAAYEDLRTTFASRLPGLVAIDDLPAGAVVRIDGVGVELDASAQATVPAGRHFVHVELSGHVVARFATRVEPASTVTLVVPVSDATWSGWLASARSGSTTVPDGIRASVAALGGEVVLAWADGRVARVNVDGVALVPSASAEDDGRQQPADGSSVRVGIGAAVGGGWFESGDFYQQDPADVPRTRSAVNAGAVMANVGMTFDVGLFRAGLGVDLAIPTGAWHTAATDDVNLRLRPSVMGAVGVRWVQATGGYLFPYHPAFGGRVTIPAWRGLEVIGGYTAGVPTTLQRADGSSYTTLWVHQAWAGVGWRFGLTRPASDGRGGSRAGRGRAGPERP